jgi:hypothetical protein
MIMADPHGAQDIQRNFYITVLGRTLEHLGVQMYKRRDIAIAELVANSWDAGATEVYITIPDAGSYDPASARITIRDDGVGMSADQVQDQYLVVGRNRRSSGLHAARGRRVMGRKGIGKLAGFGVASKVTLTTWKDDVATTLTLDLHDLKRPDGQTDNVAIAGHLGPRPADYASPSGTLIDLCELKHKTPLSRETLQEALGRRFSRTVRGEMKIFINEMLMGEPLLDFEVRIPAGGGYEEATFPSGNVVRYTYAFSKEVIQSPQMRGFTVYVAGKTAQAPPFFFNVEGTASGQHGTRYLTGTIEADCLDAGTDDESDVISTDRQEIDWEDTGTQELFAWGQKLARRALIEWANRKGEQAEAHVLQDAGLRGRIDHLDKVSQQQVSRFLRGIGQAEAVPERAKDLADAVVRAYEYRQFHDVVSQMEAVGDSPEQLTLLLGYLSDWQVLESRAILEIIRGRIEIVDKFGKMIVENAPETAPSLDADNMHDLLAGSPWLLNPDWQVLAEEKAISTQLREWHSADVKDSDSRLRYDFLALGDMHKLVIVEIKRSGHPVQHDELQRLETYKERLYRSRPDIHMLMICGGTLDISPGLRESWEKRSDGDILTWRDIYERTRRYYEHYRAVLEGEVEHRDFTEKEREVRRTQEILRVGTVYRGRAERAGGIGPQDVHYEDGE